MSPPAIRFRQLRREDLPMIHAWLNRPHVAEWWDDRLSLEQVIEDFGPMADGTDSTRGYIVCLGDEEIGFLQCYVVAGSGGGFWSDEVDPGARGTDQFLAREDLLGKGLGTAMLRAFVDQLFEDPSITKVQVDPSPSNERAIRAYRKAGFEPGPVVETPDGPARLMVCRRAERERSRAASPSAASPSPARPDGSSELPGELAAAEADVHLGDEG